MFLFRHISKTLRVSNATSPPWIHSKHSRLSDAGKTRPVLTLLMPLPMLIEFVWRQTEANDKPFAFAGPKSLPKPLNVPQLFVPMHSSRVLPTTAQGMLGVVVYLDMKKVKAPKFGTYFSFSLYVKCRNRPPLKKPLWLNTTPSFCIKECFMLDFRWWWLHLSIIESLQSIGFCVLKECRKIYCNILRSLEQCINITLG